MSTLTKIINLSLNTGKFHDRWKSAVVRLLIKLLQICTSKTNYRPVSNLSFISKIVENVLWNKLHSTAITMTYYHPMNLHTGNFMAVKPAL